MFRSISRSMSMARPLGRLSGSVVSAGIRFWLWIRLLAGYLRQLVFPGLWLGWGAWGWGLGWLGHGLLGFGGLFVNAGFFNRFGFHAGLGAGGFGGTQRLGRMIQAIDGRCLSESRRSQPVQASGRFREPSRAGAGVNASLRMADIAASMAPMASGVGERMVSRAQRGRPAERRVTGAAPHRKASARAPATELSRVYGAASPDRVELSRRPVAGLLRASCSDYSAPRSQVIPHRARQSYSARDPPAAGIPFLQRRTPAEAVIRVEGGHSGGGGHHR